MIFYKPDFFYTPVFCYIKCSLKSHYHQRILSIQKEDIFELHLYSLQIRHCQFKMIQSAV